MKNVQEEKSYNSFASCGNFFTEMWRMLTLTLTFHLIWQNTRVINTLTSNYRTQHHDFTAVTLLSLMTYRHTGSIAACMTSGLSVWASQNLGVLAQDPSVLLDIRSVVANQGIHIPGYTGVSCGAIVANAGDWNGDKIDDFYVKVNKQPPKYPLTGGYIIYSAQKKKTISLENLTISEGLIIQEDPLNSQDTVGANKLDDVNGDNESDFMLSIFGGNPNAGPTEIDKIYLLLRSELPANNIILSNITNNTGVIIQAEPPKDMNGMRASSAGDVNGDGISDILLGSFVESPGNISLSGLVYLLYGHRNLGGRINLADPVAINRTLIQGIYPNQNIGRKLSRAGDINKDGWDDFLVGAPTSRVDNNDVGSIYLVYGGPTLPSVIFLGNMTTGAGVEIQGTNFGEYPGASLADLGDFNGDGYDDFAIGVPLASRQSSTATMIYGSVYILWGGRTLPPKISLANFNANMGIEIRGLGAASTDLDLALTGKVDINNDGLMDLMMGCRSLRPFGRQYAGAGVVLFGSRNYPPILEYDQLTPTQGYVIYGNAGDATGHSVSMIKGNNSLTYLVIGAPAVSTTTLYDGAVYVITTSPYSLLHPVINDTAIKSYQEDKETLLDLVANFLYPANNMTLKISTSTANAGTFILPGFILISDNVNSWQVQSPYQILAKALQYLKFNPTLNFNSNFTITLDLISNFSRSEQYRIAMQGVPSNDNPYIFKNNEEMTVNETTVLNRTQLLAGDAEDSGTFAESQLLYLIQSSSDISIFHKNDTTKTMLQQFTQGEIDSQSIAIFSSSNSRTYHSPKFSFKLRDQEGAESELITSNITYYLLPTIVNNQLTVNTPGETVVYQTSNLRANYGEDNADDLSFTLSNVRGGYFNLNGMKQTPPFSFPQKIISMGQLRFVHDGSDQLPVYDVNVSDGHRIVGPQRVTASAMFAKNQAPYLVNNHVEVHEGEMILINRTQLLADDDTADAMTLEYLVDAATLAHAMMVNSITQENNSLRFTQADIDRSRISLQHDGSESAPVVRFRLSDNEVISEYYYLNVTFVADVNDAPTAKVAEWLVSQGQTIVLSNQQWQAVDSDNAAEMLTYSITKVAHGEFRRVKVSDAITMFTQAEIDAGQIEFVHDNSVETPEVEYTVSDGKLTTMPQQVPVKFIQNVGNNNAAIIGGSVAAGAVCLAGIFAAGYAIRGKRQADASRQGADLHITTAREAYEAFKIPGVANFKSGAGLKFIARITEINNTFQQKHGTIEDISGYSEALVQAMRQELSGDKDVVVSGRSLKFNVADESKREPLRLRSDAIIERCHTILSQGVTHDPDTPSAVPMKQLA